MALKLSSWAFREGELIPSKHTCDGENVSPQLEWEGLPQDTMSLALIADDPDAPSGSFVHWVVFDIPPTENALNEAVGVGGPKVGGGSQGRNGFGKLAYGGPCPPSGTHRYFFHLYALDATLGLESGSSRQEVDSAMKGHILAEAKLMGRYARQRA
jgi:Raf kinase inhibitor-like YbhB/YbcL family protein